MAKVLIATADVALFDVMSAEAAAEGHDVCWAVDGQEAYQQAAAREADFGLLDVNLGVFDAFETCGLLRGDPDVAADLPGILLTDDDVSPRKLEAAGFTGGLPKTHHAEDIRELLARYVPPGRSPST